MYKEYVHKGKSLKRMSYVGIDINKCQSCGKETEGKDRHVHHIDKNTNNNQLNNFMILCRYCHIKIHQKYTTNKEKIKKERKRRYDYKRYRTIKDIKKDKNKNNYEIKKYDYTLNVKKSQEKRKLLKIALKKMCIIFE